MTGQKPRPEGIVYSTIPEVPYSIIILKVFSVGRFYGLGEFITGSDWSSSGIHPN
jgi:hypothetical protein